MRKGLTFLSVLLFLSSIFLLFKPTISHADELADSEVITDFNISQDEIVDGQNLQVNVAFSGNEIDQEKNIHSGDTITVNWTQQENVSFTGYEQELPLTQEEHTIANLSVTETQAQLTFTDIVEKLDNVKGEFFFEVRGRNFYQGEDENRAQGSIQLGKQSHEVTVVRPKAGESGSFYYKTGLIPTEDPGTITWWLNANLTKQWLADDIRISDTFGSGFKLDPSTLTVLVDGASYSLDAFQQSFPTSKLSYTDSSLEVVLNKNEFSTKTVSVQYKTPISNLSQPFFENTSKIQYHILNQDPEELSGNQFTDYSVKNINAGGWAEGTVRGEVRVFKKITNTEIPIPGVTFSLSNHAGRDYELTTNQLGIADIKNVPVGKYYLKEISAPEWIAFDPLTAPVYELEIKESDLAGHALTIENGIKETEVKVTKVWETHLPTTPKTSVQLYQNERALGESVVLETGQETYTWTGLALYDTDGQKFNYSVKEVGEDNGTIALDGHNYQVTYSGDLEHGFVVANLLENPTRAIQVSKKWDDYDNQDGLRPNSIRIQLLANGKVKDSAQLSESTSWQHEFTDLPIFENGEEIKYSINEEQVEGYDTSIQEDVIGKFLVINRHTPQIISISGQKTWDDADNQDGKRPSEITVYLYVNDDLVDQVTVNETSNWSYHFDNLPKYSNGQELTYRIDESQVPDYTKEIKGFNLINHHITSKQTLSVTKVWDDKDNQDGLRPNQIEVQLYANQKALGHPVILNNANQWSYTWNDLETLSKGNKVIYSVQELTEVSGYQTSTELKDDARFVLVNRHTPEVTLISGQKTWDDADNQDGKRPNEIKVNLYSNGIKIAQQSVSAKTNWTYEFNNLPAYANGVKNVYTIDEEPVEGYTKEVKGYDLVNHYTPSKRSFTVKKVWEDNDNQDGLRPTAVMVQLFANEKASGEAVSLNDTNQWTHVWTNLDEKVVGQIITYSVKEVEVPLAYSEAYQEENGLVTITNTHIPELISIEGQKIWDDAENQDGKRPTEIIVHLFADGQKVAEQVVSEGMNWTYEFSNLPVFSKGTKINYTLDEADVKDYTKEIDGYNIINHHQPDKVTYTVSKVWDDKNNQDGLRPNQIKIQLFVNNQAVGKPVNLSAQTNWTYTWSDLNQNENGKVLNYHVEELEVPEGYHVIQTVEGKHATLINQHKPKEVIVKGQKTWDDADNQDGKRPSKLKVYLYANGKKVDEQIVSDKSNWTYEFNHLPEFENGQKIFYTIDEEAVEGYVKSIKGFNLTNRYAPGKTSVTVRKVWEDVQNQDKLRPDNVSIQLLTDGKELLDLVQLNHENDWTYTWSNLDKFKNGKLVQYQIAEIDQIDGYHTEIIENDKNHFTVINRHEVVEDTDTHLDEPEMPSKPMTKIKEKVKKSIQVSKSSIANSKETLVETVERKLPMTGENWSLTFVLLGLFFLGFGTLVVIFKHKI